MTGPRPADIVLLDALGTLVALEDPGPHLVDSLSRRGTTVELARAHAAMGAEMTHYRAHCDTARDAASLRALRDDCARIVARELGDALGGLSHADVLAATLEALRFSLYPEVPEVLRALRVRGVTLVVVSNWDVSLHDVARALELDRLVDAVLTSAEEGVAKPDPELLLRALRRGGDGVGPERALMVGDTAVDVEAGLAAGMPVVLVDRFAAAPDVPSGVEVVPDLTGLLRDADAVRA
jgi:putative hydrolase of the HAD superfamily